MDKMYLIKYSEIGIKGKNRHIFEDMLVKNIKSALRGAQLDLAAAPAIPVKDTLKQAENGLVVATPPREALFAVQTPQAFRAELIKAALSKAVQDGVNYSDDCAAVEAIGGTIQGIPGDPENIKLTDPSDLETAEAILRRRGEWR